MILFSISCRCRCYHDHAMRWLDGQHAYSTFLKHLLPSFFFEVPVLLLLQNSSPCWIFKPCLVLLHWTCWNPPLIAFSVFSFVQSRNLTSSYLLSLESIDLSFGYLCRKYLSFSYPYSIFLALWVLGFVINSPFSFRVCCPCFLENCLNSSTSLLITSISLCLKRDLLSPFERPHASLSLSLLDHLNLYWIFWGRYLNLACCLC